MNNITFKFESGLMDANSGLELAGSLFFLTHLHMCMFFYNVSEFLINMCSRKFKCFLKA